MPSTVGSPSGDSVVPQTSFTTGSTEGAVASLSQDTLLLVATGVPTSEGFVVLLTM